MPTVTVGMRDTVNAVMMGRDRYGRHILPIRDNLFTSALMLN